MDHRWNPRWTWLSIALYMALVLVVQAHQTRRGGRCPTCLRVLPGEVDNASREPWTTPVLPRVGDRSEQHL